MGFAWLALLAAIALGLLWLFKLRGPMLTLAGAAIAFGCAGYALQGRPDLEGSPRESSERQPPMSLTGARTALMGQFDRSDAWLIMAENFSSRGKTEEAAGILRSAVREHPNDYKLWVGLGNALADHSRTLSPAARFAFKRAAELAPGHPAPPFFLGLAEVRSGNPEEAARLWREILANAPANASWRPLVENGLLLVGQEPTATPPAPVQRQVGS